MYTHCKLLTSVDCWILACKPARNTVITVITVYHVTLTCREYASNRNVVNMALFAITAPHASAGRQSILPSQGHFSGTLASLWCSQFQWSAKNWNASPDIDHLPDMPCEKSASTPRYPQKNTLDTIPNWGLLLDHTPQDEKKSGAQMVGLGWFINVYHQELRGRFHPPGPPGLVSTQCQNYRHAATLVTALELLPGFQGQGSPSRYRISFPLFPQQPGVAATAQEWSANDP